MSRYADIYWESGQQLYRLREIRLRSGWADAQALLRLEDRLRTTVDVLTSFDNRPAPGNAPGYFLYFAAGLRQSDPALRAESYRGAYRALVTDDNTAEAAANALALYPCSLSPATQAAMLNSPHAHRARLLRLWERQGVSLPADLLSGLDLSTWSMTDRAALLSHQANDPAVDINAFSSVYHRVNAGIEAEQRPLELILPGLWGARLRAQRDINDMVERLLKVKQSDPHYSELARLAALLAAEELLPALVTYAEREPAYGVYCLGLFGKRAAVPYLLAHLEDVRTQQYAAEAWFWLTGERLPKRPRLHDAAASTESLTPFTAQNDVVVDVAPAQSWWAANVADWSPDERRIAGQAADADGVMKQLGLWSGAAGRDLLDLLAIMRQRPLGLSYRAWQRDIQRFSERRPVPDVAAA